MSVEGYHMRGNEGGNMPYGNEQHGNTCSWIESLLCAYIDGEASDAERASVESHISGCAHCRRELALLREAVALASVLQDADVPSELHERIMSATVRRPTLSSRLAGVIRTLRPVPVIRVCAAVGAAALVLGVLTSRIVQQGTPRRSPGRPQVARQAQHVRSQVHAQRNAPTEAAAPEPIMAGISSVPPRPQPARLAAVVSVRRAKVSGAVVRPVSSPPTTSAPGSGPEPSGLPEDSGVLFDETEWSDLEMSSDAPTQPQPAAEARPVRSYTVKDPEPKPTSSEAASQSLDKVPVMIVSVPTPQTGAEIKEWQARQLMEMSRRLAQESAHGERRQLSLDLVRMRF